MSTRNLLNLILALAVVGLVLIAVYEPGKEPTPAKATLTALKAADLARIEIRQGASTIALEKQDGRWRLLELPNVAVSEAKIDTLTSLISATSHARYATASANLEQLGLAQPELQITVNGTPLIFGGTEPLNGRRYVQVGEDVHLIDDRYSYLLRGDAASFADTALLSAEATLSAIRLPNLFLQEENGHWVLQGSEAAASADDLQRFADVWRHARALRVSKADAAVSGEAIEIQLRGQSEPLRLAVSRSDDEVVLTRADIGLSYHFTSSAAESLLKLPTSAKVSQDK